MSVSLNSAYAQFSRSDMPLAVGIQMLSKVKQTAEAQGAQMVQMLQASAPQSGSKIDIRV